jgi:hypothetical protein
MAVDLTTSCTALLPSRQSISQLDYIIYGHITDKRGRTAALHHPLFILEADAVVISLVSILA